MQPVRDGGIPGDHSTGLELKLTFKDGGAFDFHSTFEQLREQLHQARQIARDQEPRDEVILEQLPAYDPAPPESGEPQPPAISAFERMAITPTATTNTSTVAPPTGLSPGYSGAPPGYEESTNGDLNYR